MKKTAVNDIATTSLFLHLQDIDFSKLVGKVKVYDLSRQMKQLNDYAKQQSYIKELFGDIPYYFNSPSKRVYTLLLDTKVVIQDNDREINSEVFMDFKNPSLAHCWINVLASAFTAGAGRVNHNIFYLLVKATEKYARVLNIKLRHHSIVKNRYEILVDDTATRMKRYTKEDIDNQLDKEQDGAYPILKSKIFYKGVYTNNELLGLRQTTYKKLSQEDIIYLIDTSEKNPTQVTYHSIKNQKKYEETRCHLLYTFTTGFIEYLEKEWSIKSARKYLVMENYIPSKDFPTQILSQSFKLSLVDGRINRAKLPIESVLLKINKLNTSYYKNPVWATIQLGKVDEIDDINHIGNYLLLMDYNLEDFDISSGSALLINDANYRDIYPKFKKNHFVSISASQAICINENYRKRHLELEKNEDENFSDNEWTPQKYLTYNIYDSVNEQKSFLRNYEVSINQLYLKSLLKTQNNCLKNIPLYEFVQGKVFAIRHNNSEGQQTTKMLFIENDTLQLVDWDDAIIKRITGRSETLIEIDEKRLTTYELSNSFHKNFHLVISRDCIYEIKELAERVFYDENQISMRLNKREENYPKMDFVKYTLDTKYFTSIQLKRFKDFIDLEVTEELVSFSKLVDSKKGYGKKLDDILGKQDKKGMRKLKQSDFVAYLSGFCKLNISNLKTNGVVKHHQGIWYDENTKQYFVGSKNPYEMSQERGFQMRKIIAIEGNFDPSKFFPLLSVEFIRYSNYTVLPFPFTLMSYAD